MTVMDLALTIWENLGANKEEFLLALVLLFIAKAGNGKLATVMWLLGGFFLLDSLGLWDYFLSQVSQKIGVDLTSLSSIKGAIGGMAG
jgi:uncharacterized membrane protein